MRSVRILVLRFLLLAACAHGPPPPAPASAQVADLDRSIRIEGNSAGDDEAARKENRRDDLIPASSEVRQASR